MTQVYHQKACCWFYKSGSGCNVAGGCTKSFLDAHHGDVSLVIGPNGEPKQDATVNGVNLFDSETADLTAIGLDSGVSAGLIARIDNEFYEVLGTETDTVTVERWIRKSENIIVSNNGINSLLVPDSETMYTVGGYVHVKGTNAGIGEGTYEILNISAGELEIDDGMVIDNNNSGSVDCAPQTLSGEGMVIGGAYNDMQDVLDIPDAVYHDQWIFFNEDLAPSEATNGAAYHIYSAHDGQIANNTKLYIVGYNTYAYDCLPTGYGYVPEGTQNTGIHYKTALQRAQNLSDTTIKADLPTATSKNLPDDFMRIFRALTNAENIQFMGIYFEVGVFHWPVYADNESTGSIFVKHCAGGHIHYDATPAFHGGQFVRLNDSATGGCITDCFVKGIELFSGNIPTVDRSGGWDIAYNVGIYTNNINLEYSGAAIHHNIFVRSRWGVTMSTRSYQAVFNNVFYLCQRASFNLNGAEGRLWAWNNIIVMDETDPDFEGLFRIATGGTVDYFDYNCYGNQMGQPTVWVSDAGTNPDFNFDNLKKGIHDIETAPLFMDPENWDFRLRPNSPCQGTGRPDVQGTPTDQGASLTVHKKFTLYGKSHSLYGV